MTPEMLESELEDIGRFDPRRRDDLRDHIAALEADNAALLAHLRDMAAIVGALPTDDGHYDAWDAADDAHRATHPGAALLEEHRKALVRARNDGLRRAADYATHDPELAAHILALQDPEV